MGCANSGRVVCRPTHSGTTHPVPTNPWYEDDQWFCQEVCDSPLPEKPHSLDIGVSSPRTSEDNDGSSEDGYAADGLCQVHSGGSEDAWKIQPPMRSRPNSMRRMSRQPSRVTSMLHGRSRVGNNASRTQKLAALQEGLLVQGARLRTMPFLEFQRLGHIPRNTVCQASVKHGICNKNHNHLLVEVGPEWDHKARPILMVSHIWMEPERGRPDNADNHKHTIICAGVKAICDKHSVPPAAMHIFMDWTCLKPDPKWFEAYVQSMPAFIAQMSYMLVPLNSSFLFLHDRYRFDADGNPVQMGWNYFATRGWCRLEMLAGAAVAALGSDIRIYRFDISWGIGCAKLKEVAASTPGGLCVLPSVKEKCFTCCQRDHYDEKRGGQILCDRDYVDQVEQGLWSAVTSMRARRRDDFLCAAAKLIKLPTVGPGPTTAVLPASVFLELDCLPRGPNDVANDVEWVSDHELHEKHVMYFSHSRWRPDVHPSHHDPHSGTKLRWMKAVLDKVLVKEGVEEETAYICLESLFIDQDFPEADDDSHTSTLSLLVRCSCLVVFATDDEGRNQHFLDRAWLRRSIFMFRLMSAVGIYTASYVTKLEDLNSLAGLTVDPVTQSQINPRQYLEQMINSTGNDSDDPFCPYLGKVSEESHRAIISHQCETLLRAATTIPPAEKPRQRLIRKAFAPEDVNVLDPPP